MSEIIDAEYTALTTTDDNAYSLSNLPPELQAKILAASEQLKDSASITVSKIRNDQKAFIFPDASECATFAGIIVAVRHANIHFKGEYNEGQSNPPDCIAVSELNDVSNNDLTPHKDVMMPYYAGNCGGCAKLQWASDKGGKGKGKECAEYVLLAVNVPAFGDDLFLLECKKGNSKTADGYLATVSQKFGHPISVLTQFTMGAKTKWAQEFVATSRVSSDLVANLAGRIDEATAMLYARVVDAYKRGASAFENPPEVQDSGRQARER